MRDESNNHVPYWIAYSSLSCNEKELLKETIFVWHDKSRALYIPIQEGEHITIRCSWKPVLGKTADAMSKNKMSKPNNNAKKGVLQRACSIYGERGAGALAKAAKKKLLKK